MFYYGGNWLAKDVSLINNLTTSIGNSPWFNLLFEYQNLGSPISSITIAGQISIASASSTYWLGNALDYSSTTTNPANILINVLKSSPTWQPCFNVGGSTNTNGGTASGYLILTSDDITVNNIGNTAGVTLGTNVYGYVNKL